MDREQVSQAVREMNARAEAVGIKGHESAPKSPDSLRTYEGIWRRQGEAWTGLASVSRASFHVHKSALKWGLSRAYKEARKAQDQAQRKWDWEGAAEWIREAERIMDRWVEVEATPRPENGRPRASKRRHVPRDQSWASRVYEAAKEAEKPAVAVLWATGLRPIELDRGAFVDVDQDGNPTVTIRGAKVRAGVGQPSRTLTISRLTEVGRTLLDHRGPVSMDRDQTEEVLERLGQELGLRHRLSGYVFRHAFASELHADGDREATAKALGHVSGQSQGRYGSHAQATRAGGSMLRVEASRPVRRVEARSPAARTSSTPEP